MKLLRVANLVASCLLGIYIYRRVRREAVEDLKKGK